MVTEAHEPLLCVRTWEGRPWGCSLLSPLELATASREVAEAWASACPANLGAWPSVTPHPAQSSCLDGAETQAHLAQQLRLWVSQEAPRPHPRHSLQ